MSTLGSLTGPGRTREEHGNFAHVVHNFREREGLDGKTPSEAAGIRVEGPNKWLTLIQNASQRKEE